MTYPTEGHKSSYRNKRKTVFCHYVRQKKQYFSGLNEKDITENKFLGETVKLLFSDKAKLPEKIAFVENDDILPEDDKVTKMLNDVFPNVVENLDISECKFDDTFHRKTKNHPTLKVILEYKRHLIAITFP